MKTLKVALLCGLMAMSGQAFAKTTTPIVFAKGSYCGSFEGNVIGRKFTLGLMKNQTFFVNPTDRSQYKVIVKNSKGQTLKSNGGSMAGWDIPRVANTQSSSHHLIRVIIMPTLNSVRISLKAISFILLTHPKPLEIPTIFK